MAGDDYRVDADDARAEQLQESRALLETLLSDCEAGRTFDDEILIQMIKDAIANLSPVPRPSARLRRTYLE